MRERNRVNGCTPVLEIYDMPVRRADTIASWMIARDRIDVAIHEIVIATDEIMIVRDPIMIAADSNDDRERSNHDHE